MFIKEFSNKNGVFLNVCVFMIKLFLIKNNLMLFCFVFFCLNILKNNNLYKFIYKIIHLCNFLCCPKESNLRIEGNEPTLWPHRQLNKIIYRAFTFFGFFFKKIQLKKIRLFFRSSLLFHNCVIYQLLRYFTSLNNK